MISSQLITRIIIPPLPQSMLKNLAGNTSRSFVNTLCKIEMGELKVIFQIPLAKLICPNIFGQDWFRLILPEPHVYHRLARNQLKVLPICWYTYSSLNAGPYDTQRRARFHSKVMERLYILNIDLMLYRLSYRAFSYKETEIFLSTQSIGDHGGVSTPYYVLLTSQLTPSHGTCYGRSKGQLYAEITSEWGKVCTTSFPASPTGDRTSYW